ncbi:serine/threonine-protein kinase 33-like [Rhopilema esculentum]|uniref:serine/threonine-protein kinase 33-like n=1 Tax=Rhopilema esculentum TaxID=499914 RepID=UPI0031E0873E|eukprot:gene5063-175_t
MDNIWSTSRGRAGSTKRAVNHIRIEDDNDIDEIFDFGIILGQGSFGKVIEAVSKSTKGRFAVKTINKEKAGSAGVKLLEREVSIMKKVFHKHVVQLEEVYETSKKMLLVMELCDNGGLNELLKEKVRFSEEETLCIMKQLISAVVYLHENNIVHRDLKLENILLCKPDADENPINIKVTDFGLSYIRGGVGSDYMMQQVCGTPMYMAPEVITNLGYSERCDVWSCGVIMYYLLHGEPPFVANTEEELHDLIKKAEVDYSMPHWDSVSMTAKELINWMMKVDPARRCSAKEVLYDPWIMGTTHSTNGPRLNVLDLMGEELMRLKLERSQNNNESENDDNLSKDSHSSSELSTNIKSEKTKKGVSLKTSQDSSRTSRSTNDKKTSSPVRLTEKKTESSLKEKKTENNARSVPSYMQPTKSSSAPRNPNTKDKRTKR